MATIRDVAKLAGVAVTTVSRVLNNRGYISEETKKSVFKAMRELNYQPNEIARSLFRKKTNIIGLIIPTVSHPFFGKLANFIEYYAYKNDYKILLCNSQHEKEKEMDYVEMLKRNKVDGIIVGSQTVDVEEFYDLNLPLLTIDRCFSDSIPFVSSDNYQGGELATKLLIKKGCKKLAHISGNLSLNLLANQRYDVFVNTCKKSGVEYFVVETEVHALRSGQYEDIIQKLFDEHPDVDGVFASSDIIAAQLIQFCNDTGRNIPADLKIVGYDDVNIASLMVPKITTIRQPVEEMSKYAVELILKQIQGEMVPNKTVLPVTLSERQTT